MDDADKDADEDEDEEVELDMEKLAKKKTRFSGRYLRYLNSHSLDRDLGPSGLPISDAQKESKKVRLLAASTCVHPPSI